jgi:hypothetical protein
MIKEGKIQVPVEGGQGVCSILLSSKDPQHCISTTTTTTKN